jgi:hypothetical protein
MHQWFAGCCNSVMTGCTVVDYPRMIKHGGGKAAGDVAGAAICGCLNMPKILASRRGAIVTGGAIVVDPSMIKDSTDKGGCVVANTAILGC